MKKLMKTLYHYVCILVIACFAFVSCKKDDKLSPSGNPQADPLEVTSGPPGTVIVLTGQGLAGMKSIVFETGNVPAGFNPAFNNDHALVFRVPDTAAAGQQDIILTNMLDKQLRVPFNVTPLPSVATVSDYNFTPAVTQLTLSGNYLNDVTEVTLTGTDTKATIVSKSQRQLVVTLPQTEVSRTKLDIRSQAGEITTTQEFVNVDQAFRLFTDTYQNGFEGWGWGAVTISTATFKSGNASSKMVYGKGSWSANGMANWGDGMAKNADLKFLSFWIKGGSQDYTLFLTSDGRAAGFGNADRSTPIRVPAGVWTYVRLDLADIGLWSKGNAFKQLGLWIEGPDAQDETFYLDDVIFFK